MPKDRAKSVREMGRARMRGFFRLQILVLTIVMAMGWTFGVSGACGGSGARAVSQVIGASAVSQVSGASAVSQVSWTGAVSEANRVGGGSGVVPVSGTSAGNSLSRLAPDGPAEGAFAVVELFTSQGCSSCPPADRALLDLVAETREYSLPVFALSYHVDYWNQLGWTDPFSDTAYSERQRSYAKNLDGRVYTPQVIVNGTEGFVGSRRSTLNDVIQKQLKTPRSAVLEVSSEVRNGTLDLRYSWPSHRKQDRLSVAFLDPSATTKVPRGENRGETLRHVHVVRGFIQLEAEKGPAEASIEVPPSWDRDSGSVLCFVQESTNGPIRAVTWAVAPTVDR